MSHDPPTKPGVPANYLKRALVQLGIAIAILALLLGGCVVMDKIAMSAARPPANIKTIQDFRNWKADAIKGQGTFEYSNVTYTVLLGPAGRHLASGPSAYLFDEQGQFVDWTADMGDFRTVKHRFALNTANMKRLKMEKP